LDEAMQNVSFWNEYRERAGFVTAIGAINPVILTAYCLFWYTGSGAFDFWIVGIGMTVAVCTVAGLFMLMVVSAERRRRFKTARKDKMWSDVMPYDPVKARAEKEAAEQANKVTVSQKLG
jgi:hypothetical protein